MLHYFLPFDVRIWTVLAVLAGVYLLRPKNRSPFPFVNKHPNDPFGKKASHALQHAAGKIITEGLTRHSGPITIAIPYGVKIVVPASLASWVKSNKDLDHGEVVKEDFLAGYPGFEALTTLLSEDEVLKTMIRTKLSQNPSTIATMNSSLSNGLSDLWGEKDTWHEIDWHKDTTGIIARAASSVFVGPEKANDPEWLELVQTYVVSFFTAVNQLRAYPPWSRSIVQWFLPAPTTCRKLVPRARTIMNEVIIKRQQEAVKVELEGSPGPVYDDALTWSQAANAKAQAGDIQLSLAMAALFTTSEAFRQTLIEIARNQDIIKPLRKEVTEQVTAHGLTISALVNMALLDSVMKEAQRLSIALERIASKDTALPNGQIIPRGSHLMVDSTDLWNPAVYSNPDQFDGYRFLRKREAGDTSSQFVQSSANYNVFGGGRHICPGRFFANNELKLALTHILLKYDIRLSDGCDPKLMKIGFYTMVDPTVQLQVQRRKGVEGEDLLNIEV
ncbi:cytochrome P450 [Stachybotrys elegans]|uniref:Cytochrome P450 n=1 Tax=Stachybotrys elegans TaxID=80388 RepID=A0A8K0SET3_9HYPO|nr:cytochrome P450 [Stachybotrys elegans]